MEDKNFEKRRKQKFNPSQRRLDKLGVGDDVLRDDIAYLKRKVKKLLKENVSLAVEVGRNSRECQAVMAGFNELQRQVVDIGSQVQHMKNTESQTEIDDDLPF